MKKMENDQMELEVDGWDRKSGLENCRNIVGISAILGPR